MGRKPSAAAAPTSAAIVSTKMDADRGAIPEHQRMNAEALASDQAGDLAREIAAWGDVSMAANAGRGSAAAAAAPPVRLDDLGGILDRMEISRLRDRLSLVIGALQAYERTPADATYETVRTSLAAYEAQEMASGTRIRGMNLSAPVSAAVSPLAVWFQPANRTPAVVDTPERATAFAAVLDILTTSRNTWFPQSGGMPTGTGAEEDDDTTLMEAILNEVMALVPEAPNAPRYTFTEFLKSPDPDRGLPWAWDDFRQMIRGDFGGRNTEGLWEPALSFILHNPSLFEGIDQFVMRDFETNHQNVIHQGELSTSGTHTDAEKGPAIACFLAFIAHREWQNAIMCAGGVSEWNTTADIFVARRDWFLAKATELSPGGLAAANAAADEAAAPLRVNTGSPRPSAGPPNALSPDEAERAARAAEAAEAARVAGLPTVRREDGAEAVNSGTATPSSGNEGNIPVVRRRSGPSAAAAAAAALEAAAAAEPSGAQASLAATESGSFGAPAGVEDSERPDQLSFGRGGVRVGPKPRWL